MGIMDLGIPYAYSGVEAVSGEVRCMGGEVGNLLIILVIYVPSCCYLVGEFGLDSDLALWHLIFKYIVPVDT